MHVRCSMHLCESVITCIYLCEYETMPMRLILTDRNMWLKPSLCDLQHGQKTHLCDYMKPSLCDLQHGQKMHLRDYDTKPVWLAAWTEYAFTWLWYQVCVTCSKDKNTFMWLWNQACATCSMDRKHIYVTMKPSLCDLQRGQKTHLCDYGTKPVWLAAWTKNTFMWLWNQACVTCSIDRRHIYVTMEPSLCDLWHRLKNIYVTVTVKPSLCNLQHYTFSPCINVLQHGHVCGTFAWIKFLFMWLTTQPYMHKFYNFKAFWVDACGTIKWTEILLYEYAICNLKHGPTFHAFIVTSRRTRASHGFSRQASLWNRDGWKMVS